MGLGPFFLLLTVLFKLCKREVNLSVLWKGQGNHLLKDVPAYYLALPYRDIIDLSKVGHVFGQVYVGVIFIRKTAQKPPARSGYLAWI